MRRRKKKRHVIVPILLLLLALNYGVYLVNQSVVAGQGSQGISDVPGAATATQSSGGILSLLVDTFFPSAKATFASYSSESKSPSLIGFFKEEAISAANLIGMALPKGEGDPPVDESIADGEHGEIVSFEDVPKGEIHFDEDDMYDPEESVNPLLLPDTPDPIKDNTPDPTAVELAGKKPTVLIYHTHATESYMPYNAGNYHSLHENESVVNVGDIMTNVIESKYQYKVIHDKTLHDKDSYTVSYGNSLKTVKNQMKANPSLKVLLDVHRDAFSVTEAQKKSSKAAYTVNINGKPAAKVMLVVGKQNPNYKELEKFAAKIKKKMNEMYPGLLLRINTPNKKYNQYNSNYAVLIEVGCMLNTTEEAAYSGELMGNVIGAVMKDIQK